MTAFIKEIKRLAECVKDMADISWNRNEPVDAGDLHGAAVGIMSALALLEVEPFPMTSAPRDGTTIVGVYPRDKGHEDKPLIAKRVHWGWCQRGECWLDRVGDPTETP